MKLLNLLSILILILGLSSNQLVSNKTRACIRGQAEPILKKEVFPNSTFTLQADSISGIETLNLENGDFLTIKNWGCEYYVLSFRFETSRYHSDTNSMKYWHVSAIRMMDEIIHGIDSPIDIEKGLKAFNKHISGHVFDLELGTEIDFGEKEIRDVVSLDRIEKISNKCHALTISFSKGPL